MNNAQLSSLFDVIELYEQPIGPHPRGMIEMHFGEPCRTKAIEWLETHHDHFSVLIHEDTGDDVKDHTYNIRWLGPVLPIDFGFFELIKIRPDLRIHQ